MRRRSLLSEIKSVEKPKRVRRLYTKEQKDEIIAYSLEHGVASTAKQYSINPSQLSQWRSAEGVIKRRPELSNRTRVMKLLSGIRRQVEMLTKAMR